MPEGSAATFHWSLVWGIAVALSCTLSPSAGIITFNKAFIKAHHKHLSPWEHHTWRTWWEACLLFCECHQGNYPDGICVIWLNTVLLYHMVGAWPLALEHLLSPNASLGPLYLWDLHSTVKCKIKAEIYYHHTSMLIPYTIPLILKSGMFRAMLVMIYTEQ